MLDVRPGGEVFWVGLSAKARKAADEVPLDPSTRSGSVIRLVEERCAGITSYKTNLVKCPPLDEAGRLRYPTAREMRACVDNLAMEVEAYAPKAVFLLGRKVADAVGRYYALSLPAWDGFEYHHARLGATSFVAVHHPSYISVYKRRFVEEYASSLAGKAMQLGA